MQLIYKDPSVKIFARLLAVLALLAAIASYLPMGDWVQQLGPEQAAIPKYQIALVNALTVIILYGPLGLLGLKLSQKLGFARIWDEQVNNKQRFLIPALIGLAIGLLMVAGDVFFAKFNGIGNFSHPPFPTSIVVSAVAGIGEEILFRLFLIPFLLWLISWVILRKKWQNQIFWLVALFSALAFGFGHLPAFMMIYGYGAIGEIPGVLLAEILLLNAAVSIPAAYYFRKYGFLAAVGIHFWADIVWHFLWGLAVK